MTWSETRMLHGLTYNREFISKIEINLVLACIEFLFTVWLCQLVQIDQYN